MLGIRRQGDRVEVRDFASDSDRGTTIRMYRNGPVGLMLAWLFVQINWRRYR